MIGQLLRSCQRALQLLVCAADVLPEAADVATQDGHPPQHEGQGHDPKDLATDVGDGRAHQERPSRHADIARHVEDRDPDEAPDTKRKDTEHVRDEVHSHEGGAGIRALIRHIGNRQPCGHELRDGQAGVGKSAVQSAADHPVKKSTQPGDEAHVDRCRGVLEIAGQGDQQGHADRH